MSWVPTKLTSIHLQSAAAVLAIGVLTAACTSGSTAVPGSEASLEDVLIHWVEESLSGQADSAALVVVEGAPWIGFGATPEVFANGSAPYNTRNIESECSSSGALASCDVTWSDEWMDAMPDIDRGSLQITTEIRDGKIVAFREWFFATNLRIAFQAQESWLEDTTPQTYAEACSIDSGSATCSQLLVDTVEDWVADR